MLEFGSGRTVLEDKRQASSTQSGSFVDLAFLAGSLRQNAGQASILVGCFVALGIGYAMTATPLYTATSEILVDTRLAHADDGEGGNRSLAELGMDAMTIDSQVAILTSQTLAIAVLKRLHLEDAKDFAAPTTLPGAMLADVRRALGSSQPDFKDGIQADILEGFQKSIGVSRVQQTYVIKVTFTARSARRAALIANALVSVYSDAEIRSRMRARQISDRYVQTKLDEVRGKIRTVEATLSQPKDAGDGSHRDARRKLEDLQASYSALATQADSSLQHQVTPITAVSVLAEAQPPTRKSQPNSLLVLLSSIIAGCASVIALTTYRELMDKAYRLPGQAESSLGLRYIGMFPKASKRRFRLPAFGQRTEAGTFVPAQGRSRSESAREETLRAMKIAAEVSTHNDGLAVVGIVSAAHGEGRSTVAAAFADVVAKSGHRVLLVDADLRHPALSRTFAPGSRVGLTDVSGGRAKLVEAIAVRGDTVADFLPSRVDTTASDVTMLHIKGMQALLSEASTYYDCVVLDLPPLGAFSEAAALAPLIGAFFLVVEWGVTERSTVEAAVDGTPLFGERAAGIVFTKVDVGAFHKRVRGSRDAIHARRRQASPHFS